MEISNIINDDDSNKTESSQNESAFSVQEASTTMLATTKAKQSVTSIDSSTFEDSDYCSFDSTTSSLLLMSSARKKVKSESSSLSSSTSSGQATKDTLDMSSSSASALSTTSLISSPRNEQPPKSSATSKRGKIARVSLRKHDSISKMAVQLARYDHNDNKIL